MRPPNEKKRMKKYTPRVYPNKKVYPDLIKKSNEKSIPPTLEYTQIKRVYLIKKVYPLNEKSIPPNEKKYTP